jgi:hypothetical protein
MKRTLSLLLCCTLLAFVSNWYLGSYAMAKDPSTQPAPSIPPSISTPGIGKAPTTQQTKAKDPIPRDWVKIENTRYNYAFYVPKKWDKDTVNDTQADYHLPAAKNKEPPLFIFVGGDCHDTTLQAQVDLEKKTLLEQHPKAKYTKDESASLGGQPAWLLYTEEAVPRTIPPQSATQKPRTITQKINTLSMICVQGKATFTLTFVADSSAFSDNLRTVQRVVDSFAWSEPVPSAKPVDPKQ